MEPQPNFYVYLGVTHSIPTSSDFDRIVIDRINPGYPRRIKYAKTIVRAIAILTRFIEDDSPYSTELSIHFAPPNGKILVYPDGSMNIFAELPQTMQIRFCEALRNHFRSEQ